MSAATLENMAAWIERNLAVNPTLGEMSRHVGYSPYYCSAQFHRHFGMTYKQYLARRRLERAACDVRANRQRLIDIAVKHGYASQAAFTRAFSRAYGLSPARWRQQQAAVAPREGSDQHVITQ